MGLQLVQPATQQPVALEDLADHIKPVESGEEDTWLLEQIAAATATAETYLRRVLCQQQWRWTLDAFPCGVVALPKPPLLTVDSIKYLDLGGVETTLDASVYTVDAYATPGRLALAYGQVWPTARPELAAVRILLTAGYADAKSIPEGIKSGIKKLIATAYAHRESTITGTIIAKVPDAVKADWAPWKLPYFR